MTMGLNDFQVIFDRPLKTYFSGEIINGNLLVNLTSSKKFKKIKAELRGYGQVRWTESR